MEGRAVVGAFDGCVISSDAGALLLGGTDKAIGLIGRFAACFRDGRNAESIDAPDPANVRTAQPKVITTHRSNPPQQP
jgi:hypothetical protein